LIPSEKSIIIADAFHKYVETGDKSLIENYNCEDIELTLLQYSADKGWAHYNAMEKRINELNAELPHLFHNFQRFYFASQHMRNKTGEDIARFHCQRIGKRD
jgi:hypothetical protein